MINYSIIDSIGTELVLAVYSSTHMLNTHVLQLVSSRITYLDKD